MDRTAGRGAYRAARQVLMRHRDDYAAAVAAFHWPDIGDRINWCAMSSPMPTRSANSLTSRGTSAGSRSGTLQLRGGLTA